MGSKYAISNIYDALNGRINTMNTFMFMEFHAHPQNTCTDKQTHARIVLYILLPVCLHIYIFTRLTKMYSMVSEFQIHILGVISLGCCQVNDERIPVQPKKLTAMMENND